MSIADFVAEVILISASGVLFPGPLFLANLIYGSRTGIHAGYRIALGHAVVEFPLIILIGLSLFGFSNFIFTNQSLRIIGILGGAAIIYFSIFQVYNLTKKVASTQENDNEYNKSYYYKLGSKRIPLRGPFIIGIVFTAFNPFFLAWWITVGVKLVSDSISIFGIGLGVVFLFLFHVWMDFAWLGLTSSLIYRGKSIVKSRYYYLFILSLSAILVLYGFYVLIVNITL